MTSLTLKQEALIELLKRYPNAPTLTLAKLAFKTEHVLFSTVEDARSGLRYLRGANGNHDRKNLACKEFVRPPQPHSSFAALPQSLTHFNDWKAVQVDGPLRALVLSDLHIPYHDFNAVTAALKFGKKYKPTHILLNGDIADHFSVSFWDKDPRHRNFKNEVSDVLAFLHTLRDGFPKAKIIYKLGNHEERYERYMKVRAPELLGVGDFELGNIYDLNNFRIELVDERRPIRLGKLNTVHGHEFRFAISGPVNPARGFYMKAKTHVLGGHFHQASSHSEKSIEEHVIASWSTGCLCDMHPDYAPINNWCHGFATVEIDSKGAFSVDNMKIIDNQVYHA